ncbi:Ig-like domain-containing protein [Pontibacillus salipaludis]|uniref:Ig-like domain-containing protein n=1 Tax=Pontibacillus salipaludis TaxID=1697394 RepID=UPI0031EADDDB
MKESNHAKIAKEQQKEKNERGSFEQDSKEKKKIAQEKAVNKRLENLEKRLSRITVQNQKISDRMEEFFDGVKEKGEEEEEVADEEEREEEVAGEEEQEEEVAGEEEQEEEVADEEEREEVVTDVTEQEEEEELENYDDQADSFSGKLQAQHNKLDAVERYINHLSDWSEKRLGLNHSYTDQLKELYDELAELRQSVNEMEGELEKKEKEVAEKVEDENKEDFGSKENINSDKVWNIQFNADLSAQAVDQLNFIVFDEEMKVVPVQVSYDEVSKTVSLAPEKSYNSGETYTLFIAKDITSEQGIGLKQAVQMNFTIE